MTHDVPPHPSTPAVIRSALRLSIVLVSTVTVFWMLRAIAFGAARDVALALVGAMGTVTAVIENRRRHPRGMTVLVTWLVLAMATVPFSDPWVGGTHVVSIMVIGGAGTMIVARRSLHRYLMFLVGAWVWMIVLTIGRLDDPFAGLQAAAIQLMGLVIGGGLIVSTRRHLDAIASEHQDLYDGVPVGLFRTTPEGTIEAANVALARMLGAPDPASLIGDNAKNYYHDADDRDKLIGEIDRNDGSKDVMIKLRRSDGSPLWARETLRVIRGPNGQIEALEGALTDISDQVQARADATRATQLFSAAFEHAPTGMALLDPAGEILRFNAAFRAVMRLEPGDDATLHWKDIGGDDPDWLQLLDEPDGGEETEHELVVPSAENVWVRVGVFPVDAPGENFLVAQVLDITAQKQLQLSLEDRVREKDRFVASVSHELRTPLTAIVGFTGLLTAPDIDMSSTETSEMLGLVHEQSKTVGHIVEDLLVAARSDIGQLSVNPETVEVMELARRAVVDCSPLRTGNMDVVYTGDARAWADPLRVQQILRNLVSNAYRYGSGTVEISASNGGTTACIRVADEGEGIPVCDREAIFEPYHRAHRESGVTGSIGLGLAVSRTLASAMGGDLVYEYEDGHSVFELSLPAGPPH